MPISVEAEISRSNAAKAGRGTFDSHLEDVRNFLRPDGEGFVSTTTPGAKNRRDILDNSGEDASEILAAGLTSMLTNPFSKWLGMRARDDRLNDREDMVLYLEEQVRRLYGIFNNPSTGHQPNMHELYLDLPDYGTGCMYIAERPGNLPLFQTRSMNEIYYTENNEGRVDMVDRRWTWTARQAFQQFREKAGEKVVEAAQDVKKMDRPFEFLHATYPNTEGDPRRRDIANMPFVSRWINVTEKHDIKLSGFPEFPYLTPRWSKRPSEVYGRGPGMRALGDVKMLQRVMRATIRGAEKTIDPPLVMPDDGIMSPITMAPSGMNFARWDLMRGGRNPIQPILTGGKPDFGEEFMEGIRDRIRVHYYNHLLQFPKDPRMTATQFIDVAEETMRLLGPVVGRQQTEVLQPKIERTWGIAMRAGILQPLPTELEEEGIQVEFVSPIAKAQRLSEARGIAQTMEVMRPFADLDSTVLDNQDADKTYRHVADLFGQPKELLRTTDQVIEIRSQREEARQRVEQKQDLVDAADAASKMGVQLGGGGAQNAAAA